MISARWRGLTLRNHSVRAWRELWAWMVNGIDGLTPRTALGDQFADAFADLADGPLAHLPSSSFPANAAWLACRHQPQPAARRRIAERPTGSTARSSTPTAAPSEPLTYGHTDTGIAGLA